MTDDAFQPIRAQLESALGPLLDRPAKQSLDQLPKTFPATGQGTLTTLEQIAPIILGGAQELGAPHALAHMDPPTPWVSWVTTFWNASLNQNLLHPDMAPVARDIEARTLDWLAPFFGMDGGHMTPGSSVSNLSALWAAREVKGVTKVIASKGAHLSVGKAAHILGLDFLSLDTDECGGLDLYHLPEDLNQCALVLTAGATSTGAIDRLDLCGRAAWTHVDAAWSGALIFSKRYRDQLKGIEQADSLSLSAHKWLFQPKESALVLFKDTATAHPAISFAGAYLATPNIGVLGSHGASAVSLMATFLAFGQDGLAHHIEKTVSVIDGLYDALSHDPRTEVFSPPQSAILLWRPRNAAPAEFRKKLPDGLSSLTEIKGQPWLRQVGANPMADLDIILEAIDRALTENASGKL